MRLRIFLYTKARILFGLFLVLHASYNAIGYSEFLIRINLYFTNTTVFNMKLIEILAPLVPFEEFIIGLLLIIGFLTRKSLIAAMISFAVITGFLFDANSVQLALLHMIFFFISLVLLMKIDYNLNSIDYQRESL